MKGKGYNSFMLNKDPKGFSDRQLRYVFRRIISRIKQKPKGYFIIKHLRGACGLYCWGESIQIDPRKEFIPTIIHEVLHDLYPNNWEGWTARVESKIVNILKPHDIYELLNVFMKRVALGQNKLRRRKKRKLSKSY